MPAEEQSPWMHIINNSAPFIYVVPLLFLMVIGDIRRKHSLATGCLAAAWLIMLYLYLKATLLMSLSIPLPSKFEIQMMIAEPLIYNSTGLFIASITRLVIRTLQGPITSEEIPIRCSRWIAAAVIISVLDVVGCTLLYLWIVAL